MSNETRAISGRQQKALEDKYAQLDKLEQDIQRQAEKNIQKAKDEGRDVISPSLMEKTKALMAIYDEFCIKQGLTKPGASSPEPVNDPDDINPEDIKPYAFPGNEALPKELIEMSEQAAKQRGAAKADVKKGKWLKGLFGKDE
ncbi:hypothetical protein [Burkholderia pseudomallei]|uniref:hypothetical protein n=1 Tax=Burkholderia pseudomallei TaxID=28450 RepID=UPI000A6F2440|nr:hypothetical protein [Burkholderia pseudomallei]